MFASNAALCRTLLLPRRGSGTSPRVRKSDRRVTRRGVPASASLELEPDHKMAFPPEMHAAVEAVQLASRLCMATQDTLSRDDRAAKSDDSPVTVADFAAQALVSLVLERSHPDIQLVAEETATGLRTESGSRLLRKVTDLVNETLRDAARDGFLRADWSRTLSAERVASAIDRGAGEPSESGSYWILDPIDGTKGFINGRQYAVALGYMKDGKIVGGILGCPNMPMTPIPDDATFVPSERPGIVFIAYQGCGCLVSPTDSRDPLDRKSGDGKKTWCASNQRTKVPESSYMESWGDSVVANGDTTAALSRMLGSHRTPVRVDSMAKYGALAKGDADLYLRFPPRSYREKVWDHAAGVAVVEQAGGVITDGEGNALDFTKGRYLDQKGGIVASANPALHAEVLAALKKMKPRDDSTKA